MFLLYTCFAAFRALKGSKQTNPDAFWPAVVFKFPTPPFLKKVRTLSARHFSKVRFRPSRLWRMSRRALGVFFRNVEFGLHVCGKRKVSLPLKKRSHRQTTSYVCGKRKKPLLWSKIAKNEVFGDFRPCGRRPRKSQPSLKAPPPSTWLRVLVLGPGNFKVRAKRAL